MITTRCVIVFAFSNAKWAAKFAGSLGAIKQGVDAIPQKVFDNLPQSAQDAITDLRTKLGEFAVDESGALKIPSARTRKPNDPIVDGLPYTQTDYDAYVSRKTAVGETPRSPEDYAAARDHWRQGGAAHQSAVDAQIEELQELYPDVRILETPSINTSGVNSGVRTSYPDLMVIDDDSLKFVEVKTGGADLTQPQSLLSSDLDNATLTNAQANRLGLDPNKTLSEQFPGGVSWETATGPGYKD